jgi:hypothetical protein
MRRRPWGRWNLLRRARGTSLGGLGIRPQSSSMQLGATRGDGEARLGAAAKSDWPQRTVFSRRIADSECLCLVNRESDPRGDNARNHGLAGADAPHSAR